MLLLIDQSLKLHAGSWSRVPASPSSKELLQQRAPAGPSSKAHAANPMQAHASKPMQTPAPKPLKQSPCRPLHQSSCSKAHAAKPMKTHASKLMQAPAAKPLEQRYDGFSQKDADKATSLLGLLCLFALLSPVHPGAFFLISKLLPPLLVPFPLLIPLSLTQSLLD